MAALRGVTFQEADLPIFKREVDKRLYHLELAIGHLKAVIRDSPDSPMNFPGQLAFLEGCRSRLLAAMAVGESAIAPRKS